MIYSSDAGVFAVSSDTSVFINRKALSTPRELRSGDIIGIGKRRFAVEFFEAPARFGNVRQSPEEESLGVVYEKLKSVFRWVGLMRD
ncbi:MAG: hypothetical protein IT209_05185 [Armatimonadetes bacterium]|nr:hypothetical protein [Armatimonadota bacterium]